MNITIKIDGKRCDIGNEYSRLEIFNSNELSDLESLRNGRSITILLPTSKANDSIIGSDIGFHSGHKFNSSLHTASLEVEGTELFEGVVYLKEVGKEGYKIEIKRGAPQWIQDSAETLLWDMELPYSQTITQTTPQESWDDDSPIKFLPIERDHYPSQGSSVEFDTVRRILTIDNFHPFINIRELLLTIIEGAGYSLASNFIDSEEFRDLYMSGNYNSMESTTARNSMGFLAKRAESGTTTGDLIGRVMFSPYTPLHSVGNIVNLDSTLNDKECYNRGNCLTHDGTALIYRPLTSISTGFEFHLHYTTDYTIASRERLKGFDTFGLGDGEEVEWVIKNRFEDKRTNIESSHAYTIIVFDHIEGQEYQLVGVTSIGNEVVLESFATRTTTYTASAHYESYKIRASRNNSTYTDYAGDWAAYDSYITERGETEVDITIRNAPQKLTPSTCKHFDNLYIKGASPDDSFTLLSDSSLRPYFAAYPGYGSTITFKDIAQHSFYQLELFKAIQHLFNLRFHTDERSRMLYVEPFNDFYTDSLFDWTSKLSPHQEITLEDLSLPLHRKRLWGYQQLDGKINRASSENPDATPFGEWSYELDSYASRANTETLLNPLFSATTSNDEGIMVVGDRDDINSVDSLNFSPRIVRLFNNQIVNNFQSLPFAAFHAPDQGFSLCFEDRDNTSGLNKHLNKELSYQQRSTYITLNLDLSPHDIEMLLSPTGGMPSIRSAFGFNIAGEWLECHLASIESYAFESGIAKCKFININ